MASTEQERYTVAVEAARKVFGNDDDAVGWLNERCAALGQVIPKSLLSDDDGLECVLYELHQMEYGHPV